MGVSMIVALLDSPSAPITGWEIMTEINANTISKKTPRVTTDTIYTYLSAHAVSQGSGDGTFRTVLAVKGCCCPRHTY